MASPGCSESPPSRIKSRHGRGSQPRFLTASSEEYVSEDISLVYRSRFKRREKRSPVLQMPLRIVGDMLQRMSLPQESEIACSISQNSASSRSVKLYAPLSLSTLSVHSATSSANTMLFLALLWATRIYRPR